MGTEGEKGLEVVACELRGFEGFGFVHAPAAGIP